jgi:hypothetical protein
VALRAPRRRLLALLGAAIAVGSLALVWLLRPPSAASLALALAVPATETWLAPVLEDVRRDELVVTSGDRRLVADLYRPSRARSALLLVHGLSRAGRRHPELVRLARLLARQGSLVMVPQLDGLAAFRLEGREIADIRAALAALAERHRRVGIAGFSFGAGPALIAAAGRPELTLAGSFGGYADLRSVIRYLTTGLHQHAGRRHHHPPEEYNRWKLLALLVGVVQDPGDRERLAAIADRRLADPGADTRTLEAGGGREARAVLALVTNRRDDAVEPLLAALPGQARAALDALSPIAAIPRLGGRLLIAHGAGDASIPFTESLRLAEAGGERARLFVLESFDHVGPLPLLDSIGAHARDSARLLEISSYLIEKSHE